MLGFPRSYLRRRTYQPRTFRHDSLGRAHNVRAKNKAQGWILTCARRRLFALVVPTACARIILPFFFTRPGWVTFVKTRLRLDKRVELLYSGTPHITPELASLDRVYLGVYIHSMCIGKTFGSLLWANNSYLRKRPPCLWGLRAQPHRLC